MRDKTWSTCDKDFWLSRERIVELNGILHFVFSLELPITITQPIKLCPHPFVIPKDQKSPARAAALERAT